MAEKRGRGKPRWVPPDPDKVEALAARGLTLEQIAHCLGICYDTLNETKKRHADFADAIKRGKAKGISIVTNALFEQVKKGNVTAMIFFLKCRAEWKEAKDSANLENNQTLIQQLVDKL
jgi:hypothetical protein